jgi:hypothetical protein
VITGEKAEIAALGHILVSVTIIVDDFLRARKELVLRPATVGHEVIELETHHWASSKTIPPPRSRLV